ncbi:MAG: VCBS repeat-containing protein, partial [Sphingobacteriales bacterium]
MAGRIHRGMTGFEVYKGFYDANNQLNFSLYRQLWYLDTIGFSTGWVNAYCDPGDIPGMVDVDNDGDLDFFGFSITGANIQFYRNLQVEHGLPCDSIRIRLEDNCWGKISQGFERTQYLGISCGINRPAPPIGPDGMLDTGFLHSTFKTTLHTGNTLCFFDADNDNDKDYLNGNISFSDIQYLRNGKADYSWPRDTIVSQDTTWQSGGHPFHMSSWPSAFWIDYDQDGKKDIVLTPHAENASENYKCVAWYRNTGTTGNPVYTYQGDSLLSNRTIDMGTGAYPMLYDYNKDGKLDLFVGGDGYYQSTGNLQASIKYYRNTSTTGQPSFTLEDDDFLAIKAEMVRGAYP